MRYIKRSGIIVTLTLIDLLLPNSMTVEVIDTQDNPVVGNVTFQMIQQQEFVSGDATDVETQEPFIGASIKIKGTNIAIVADANGRYQLQLRAGQDILVFPYIGKKPVETQTNGRARLNVVVESNENTLSDIVIYTEYLTQKKADLTGSVAIANQTDIARGNLANVMKGLQGRMADVQIITSDDDPVESANIQIRGLSSLSGGIEPFVVLDGMPTEEPNLRDINADDIEPIQVLKDAASASIYGARTSGDVVLIQAKEGKQDKTTIEYRGSISTNTVINKLQLVNVEEYGTAEFRVQACDGKAYGTTMSLFTAYDFVWHRDVDGYAYLGAATPAEWLTFDKKVVDVNTDWMNEIFGTVVPTNCQLTISSGNDRSRSLFSLGYFNNQRTQIHAFFKKYSIRANSEYNLL